MTQAQPPIVPCKGSFATTRQINAEKFGVGNKLLILRHPTCNCNTGCRRVTLWHPRPQGIEGTDDWLIKAIARVRWGDGCGGPEVEVDWKHGVILDLSGCYDEVALEFVEGSGTLPDEDNLLTFGVLSACCGAGAARGCATRTTAQVTAPDAGGSVLIPIPPFAYAVTFAVASGDFFVATTNVAILGSGIGAIQTVITGDALPDPLLLPGGAESIFVSNDAVAGDLIFEAVFLIGV